MANKIVLKKSSVAGKVPLSTDLEIGELAVNLADAKLYSKDAGGTVIAVGGGSSGGGDVVGPSSATDNAIARYDGTTGKLIQNSGVTIDDNGNVINPLSIKLSGSVPTSPTPGALWFDSTTDTLNLQQNAITQQIGEELFIYGKASSAISGETVLQAIYKTGTVGASGVIKFAPTVSGITDGSLIVGVGTEDIATNGFGRITCFGIVHGINTTGSTYSETWADGDDIWYNPTTGGLTKTKPSAPNIKVQVGTVINAGSGGSGSFQVLLNTGSSLGGTDDNVQITTPTGGQILSYDGSAGYWKNTNAIVANTSTDALRITQTGSGNALVVEDSANPDSTAFVITNNGNVIQGGTTSFNTGTAAEPWFAITSPNIYGPQLIVDNTSDDPTAGYTNFRKSRNGAVVQNGDTLGTYVYQGFDGTNYINAAEIAIKVDGTPDTNDMPGRIIFATTADGASSSTERMRIDNAGRVGVGTTSTSGYRFLIGGNLTDSVNARGLAVHNVVTSSTNTAPRYIATLSATASNGGTSYTVGSLYNFNATQGTFNADSTVTTQIGFFADSSLTGATNNYGFYSNLSVGTGRYNFYASGSAANYFAGSIGVGSLPIASANFLVAKAITGAATAYGILNNSSVQSDVTTSANIFQSQPTTATAAFSLTSLRHLYINQSTINAGAVITNQYGCHIENSNIGATNNYGAYSNINEVPSGGTATSSVSTVSSSGTTVTVVTAAAHGLSTNQVVTIPLTANATDLASGVTCTIKTVGDTDFTLIGAANNNVGTSFTATGAGTGTGTVTLNQQNSGKTITVVDTTTFTYTSGSSATFSAITASGTVTPSTRWNFYGAGTAPNYFNGSVGVGTTIIAGYGLHVAKNVTGATTSRSIRGAGTVQSDVTASARGVEAALSTQATSFTLTELAQFMAQQGTIGAGSTVTNQFGFIAQSTLTGATNNYGFYSNIAAGGARYNFYAAGTAVNYFAGQVGIGASPAASAKLDVQSTTSGVRFPNMTTTQKNAISSPAAGLVVFDTTLAKLCVYTGAAWQTITSA